MADYEDMSKNSDGEVMIEPLSSNIGAEVRGVDLGYSMNDAVFATI